MNWLQENSAWIIPLATVMLSSIITVLSKYPTSAPANEIVTVLRLIQQLMGRFSALPHADGAPLVQLGRLRLSVPGIAQRAPGSKPAVALWVPGAALLLAGAIAISGCAHTTAAKVGHEAVDCVAQFAAPDAAAALDDVIKAFQGQQVDWGAIGALETAHGVELVLCLAGKIVQDLTNPPPGAVFAAQATTVAVNAQRYLNHRLPLEPKLPPPEHGR